MEASGGTGKTFCLGTIYSELRAKGKTVLVMAITNQAATLLEGGSTVHYQLKIPIKLDDGSRCSIKRNSYIETMIKKASLLIIDEYTMGNKKIYETIDRSFKDLFKNDLPFGGKLMLFSGDWAQCLPVVPNR